MMTSRSSRSQAFTASLFLAVIALLVPQVVASDHQPDGSQGTTTDDFTPVDRMMKAFVQEHGVPGAAIAIMKDGRVLHEGGYGLADVAASTPVTPASRFRIASISKPITAVAIMQLVEQGKLSLSDNPFNLIGLGVEIRSDGRDPRLRAITIEHLLTHRAGWDRNVSQDPMFMQSRISKALELEQAPTPEEVIRYMIDQPLDFDPGTQYAYSNFGYCLLGRVIEQVTGKSYEAAVRERVLEPIGITSMAIGRSFPEERLEDEVVYHDQKERTVSSWKEPERRVPMGYIHDQEVMDAHGGWIATATDVARFAGAFSDLDRSPLLKRDSIKQMWAPPTPERSASWYARGWLVNPTGNTCNAWHNGALTGSTSTIMVLRHDGYSWAVLFNTDYSKLNDAYLHVLIRSMVRQAMDASIKPMKGA